ncbi:MAG: YgjP-like metallopeptidase domain-containing protein [Streptomyces sp.]
MTYNAGRTSTVGDITIHVRTSNRASLDLDVTATGQVIVRGPHRTTDAQAADLAQRRRHWVYRQLQHVIDTTPSNPAKALETGTEFSILGQPHLLRIVPDTQQAEPLLRQQGPATGFWITMRCSTAQICPRGDKPSSHFASPSVRNGSKSLALT